MSLQAYQVCGHCNQLLSEKALKEHRRLYFDDQKGEWIKLSKKSQSNESNTSSPIDLSPPGSNASQVESIGEGSSQLSIQQPFEDPGDMDVQESPGAVMYSMFLE